MTLMTRLALLALCALAGSAAAAELTVDEFVADSGVREGATPIRQHPGWTAEPTILVRAMSSASGDLAAAFPGADIIVVTDAEAALPHAGKAHAIVGFCGSELVDAAPRLAWVQVYSSGVERCLENDAFRSGQVVLTNMQKMSSPMIGEHAIALLLGLTRNLPMFARTMPEGAWRRDLARESRMTSVQGKTMLVVGLGGIGKQAALRAKGLGMRVVATRNSSREGPSYVDYVGLADELHTLAGEADVIVNALPLTPETEGLFDEAFFAQTKPGSLFINVGRGGTVVTNDLVAALDTGHLGGAGLDVTAPEPLPPDHPQWQMPNVIITPHVAGFGGSREWHAMLVRENIRRFLAGDALFNVVDPERGY